MCWLHEFSFSFTKERQQERYMRACVQKLEPPIQALPCCAGNKFKLAVRRTKLVGFCSQRLSAINHEGFTLCAERAVRNKEMHATHRLLLDSSILIDFSSHLKGFVLQCRTLQRVRATDCSDSPWSRSACVYMPGKHSGWLASNGFWWFLDWPLWIGDPRMIRKTHKASF
jgi:hypothetical protein